MMMASIAVASQFGNSAYIAPEAKTDDGKTDIVLIEKMSTPKAIGFIYQVFQKKIRHSAYAKTVLTKNATIKCDKELPMHIDGEVRGCSDLFKIETVPEAINLIIP
jgi:diacylglycerol kinase family enzyme